MTAVPVLLAFAWWASGLRPFTRPALAVTLAAGLAAAAVGGLGGLGPRPPVPPVPAAGAAIWLALFTALAGWELVAFLGRPRSSHPTLSSLADAVLAHRPARALAFVLWLGLGAHLARR